MAKKCMQCGGKVKMAKGGSTPKPFAAGIPYAAGAGQTDGKNGKMQRGGKVKSVSPPKTQTVVIKPKSSDAYEVAKKAQAMKSSGLAMKHKGQMMKAEGQALKAKGQAMKATGSIKPKTGMDGINALADHIKKGGVYKKGGSTFGMLSVKAGIDKNPGKTAADRIAGAKMKMRKKK